MKRFAVLACILSLAMIGCDKSISPVTPTGVVTLVAVLSGASNVPPAASYEAGATGTAQITMTPAGSGAYTASVTLSLSSLLKAGVLPPAYAPMDTGGTTIVAGLIQQGAAGTVGPAVVQLPIGQTTAVPPIYAPTGTVLITLSNVTVPASSASAILANPGGFYLNLYSALNQNGVLRGQLIQH